MIVWEWNGISGLHVNMSRTLNKYIVTNCSTKADSNNLNLVIRLERLSGPFWFSLFIPSVCLILAAEVALFIDDSHFEAMIMVALTSNLVMYTLYHSIQDKLPEDSSIKLIDIWLLHGLLMPMVVFVTLAANELIHPKAHKFSNIKIANSAVQVPRHIGQTPPEKNKMKICIQVWKAIIPSISILGYPVEA